MCNYFAGFTEEPGKEAPESRVLNNGRPLGYVPSLQTTTPRYNPHNPAFTTPSIDCELRINNR